VGVERRAVGPDDVRPRTLRSGSTAIRVGANGLAKRDLWAVSPAPRLRIVRIPRALGSKPVLLDVLLPEAIIQLHALRRGLLRGAYVHDSDPEIETAIHAEAQASLASEAPIDRWVDELMMDRQARRLGMGLPMVDSEARDRYDGILPEGSVRSRKRTVKSYKE